MEEEFKFSEDYESKNNDEEDYEEEDVDSDDSDLGETIGTIIGEVFVRVMETRAKIDAEKEEREAQREAERRERNRLNKEKRRAWRRKHRKGIVISILILDIVIFVLIGYCEFQKLLPIGWTNKSLEGLKYTVVVQRLKESGFSNIHTKEISDLTISRENEENYVTDVKLLFGDSFAKDTKYPSNLRITVVYHTLKLYSQPLTSKEAKGMNYKEVIDEFDNIGFTNITTKVKYDIITGWLVDDGEVKSITINGKKKFDSENEYRLDAKVVITYHTLRKNKPK